MSGLVVTQQGSKPSPKETPKLEKAMVSETTSLPPLSKAEKLSVVGSIANSLNKQYDTRLVQKLGVKKTSIHLPSIPSNLPTVDDYVIGCGGFPRGKVVEIYGPESAGKTAFSCHMIAQAQAAGGLAAFVDAEHALMLNHAKTLGVDIDELIISQPDYGEQAIEVVLALAESRAVDIIVIDSVSALIPKAELEGDMTDASMGMQARLMSKALRKLVGVASKTGTVVIFINQVREKIGVMFGNPETTTGGRALKFYTSLRFEVRRLSKSAGGEILDPETQNHIGHRMRIKNIKNKVGNPYRETVVDLIYESGFDKRADTVEFLVNNDVITSGAYYTFEGEKTRKKNLTEEPLWDRVAIAAKKVIDDRLKAA